MLQAKLVRPGPPEVVMHLPGQQVKSESSWQGHNLALAVLVCSEHTGPRQPPWGLSLGPAMALQASTVPSRGCTSALQGVTWRQLETCGECAAKVQVQLKATRRFTSRLPVVRLTRWRLHAAPGVQVSYAMLLVANPPGGWCHRLRRRVPC